MKPFRFEERTVAEDQAPDPVFLDINGDKIKCVPELDGLVLMGYYGAMSPGQPYTARCKAINDWLHTCIPDPEEYEKFEKIVAKLRLQIEDLSEIAGELVDTYAALPTKPAESSSTGQDSTGDSSPDVSS